MPTATARTCTIAALCLAVVTLSAWLLRGEREPISSLHAAAGTAPAPAGPQPAAVGRRLESAAPRSTPARLAVQDGRVAVAGRVVTTAGAPVSGASVRTATGDQAIAAEDGCFELRGLPPGEHWLHAEVAGYVSLPAAPVRTAPEERVDDIVLVLVPERALVGRVVSAEGAPIVDATIAVDLIEWEESDGLPRARAPHLQGSWSGQSDADGRFRVGGLPPGTVEVAVEHADYLGFGRRRPTDAGPMEVRLQRIAGVHGRLRDETGRPVVVERVTLLVSRDEEDGPWLLLGEPVRIDTEPDGGFRLPVRTRRTCRVIVEGHGVGRAVSTAFRTDGISDHGPLVLQAPAGWPVAGRVVDDLGRPVARASIVVRELVGKKELVQTGAPFELAAVSTGADGRFVTAPLAAGRYVVAVAADGCAAATSAPFEVRPGGAPAELAVRVARSGAIHGALADVSGRGLPELEVSAEAVSRTDDERRRPPARTRVLAGRFQFDALAPGRYQLALRAVESSGPAAGTALETIDVEVVPGRVSEVAFPVDALGQASVVGTLWVDGAPAPRVEVRLQGTAHPLSWVCVSDRHGAFRFEAVPPGSHIVSSPASRGGELWQRPVEVGDQSTVRADLRR